mmetsp:Transcript_14154/g.15822  ORF Transcript_14154/g.15822 Transcript_14154/m.15822 type:complete len:133 (+) Transcript_14154:72-470(+)
MNIIFMIADVALIVYVNIPSAHLTFLFPIHGVILLPSIIYHFFPNIRSNLIFNWFAHLISSLSLGLMVVSIVAFVMMEDGFGKIGMLVLILVVTLPAALIGLSLIVLLSTDTKNKRMIYYVQNNGGYARIMI